MFSDFHTRSAFSFLEAASLPEDLVQRAADLGHACHGADGSRQSRAARRASTWRRKRSAPRRTSAPKSPASDGDLYPLLVENRTGYQNLCRLITSMKLRAPKGRSRGFARKNCGDTPAGLVCLTGEGPPTRERFEKLTCHLRARATSTPNCSAISIAMRKRAIRPWSNWRDRCNFLCSPPTASATPLPRSANCSTCSPPSITRPR